MSNDTQASKKFQNILERLKVLGRNPWFDDFMCTIHIPAEDGFELVFGTANETWGADVYYNDDFLEGRSFDTELSSEETNPLAIALTLHEATKKFEALAADAKKWGRA